MRKFTVKPKQSVCGSSDPSYPTELEIANLEQDPSNSSVEDAYYDQCIDAISDGLEEFEWDSDTYGVHIFEYDEDEDESYEVGSISNDILKELEIQSLRNSASWQQFHDTLSSVVHECF